ncbi:MAG: hypothetical protein JO301_08985 [Chitinophagaceae bacterium]|nr:hypothetical protein [Chitinophagaceae bacterium]
MLRILISIFCALPVLSCSSAGDPKPVAKDSSAIKSGNLTGTPDSIPLSDTATMHRDTLR